MIIKAWKKCMKRIILGLAILICIFFTACKGDEIYNSADGDTIETAADELESDIILSEESEVIDISDVNEEESTLEENVELLGNEELGEKITFLDNPESPIITGKTESVYTDDGILEYSIFYEYYEDGSLKSVTGQDGTTEYTYDEYGNIATKTYNSDNK